MTQKRALKSIRQVSERGQDLKQRGRRDPTLGGIHFKENRVTLYRAPLKMFYLFRDNPLVFRRGDGVRRGVEVFDPAVHHFGFAGAAPTDGLGGVGILGVVRGVVEFA